MKCIGVFRNHRLYYDIKHDEYLLMTPNFRFVRGTFGHCHKPDVVEWAYKKVEQHRKMMNKAKDTKKW